MRQPATGCNAPPAIVTAAAQFVAIEDVRSKTCGIKPIDYSYSLGYHVSPPFPLPYSCFFTPMPRSDAFPAILDGMRLSRGHNEGLRKLSLSLVSPHFSKTQL